jgi:spermidine synthase
MSSIRADKTVIFVYLLAFFSGVAAIVYEVTWARMLALTFGSTTLSVAAVVVGFMGGMGVGAALYHRFFANEGRPLWIYAFLEYGIALSTAILSLGFYALPEYFSLMSQAIPSPAGYLVLRFVTVLVLIAIPSMLMGATFPALCRSAIQSAEGFNRRLGWIYGVNTLGAALGALFAGLVLVEYLGLRGSTWVANGLNITVGTAALLFLRSPRGVVSELPGPTAIPTLLPSSVTAVVLFCSGLATLSYEILWFRGLRYLVGSNSYAFAVVLFTFLSGLGLGSLLFNAASRRRYPERDLMIVQCLTAVLAVCGVGLLSVMLADVSFEQHVSIFMPEVRFSPWWQRLGINLCLSIAVLLPATLFMGLAFPLATKLYLGDVQNLDRRVGSSYLLANLGSVLGSIGAAVILLPFLGVVRGTFLVAGLNLGAALFVALKLQQDQRRTSLGVLGISAVLVTVLFIFLPQTLTVRGEALTARQVPEEIFLREGDVATVQVLRDRVNQTQMAMAIDGFKIGWSEGFRGSPSHLKQTILADLPLVLDTRLRTTLSVGLGSAGTLATLGSYPDLEHLDCVEISSAVVEASKLFEESAVLSDPRTTVIVDDAIHYLLRSNQRYDLVVSDGKQDPFYSGNANLLCQEFYRYVFDHLTEQGMLVQWFPLSTLSSDLRTIVATLSATFPHLDAFYFPPYSLLLVAGKESLRSRPIMRKEAFELLPVAERMSLYSMGSPADILSNWVAGRDDLLAAVDGAPVSTWDRLILDHAPFKASSAEWQEAFSSNLRMLVGVASTLEASDYPWGASVDMSRFESMRLMRKAWLARVEGQMDLANMLAEQALDIYPGNSQARAFLVSNLLK